MSVSEQRPVGGQALASALHRQGVDLSDLVEQRSVGRRRPVRRFKGHGIVVDVATAVEGQRLNLLEVHGRAWADAAGLPTVPVVDADAENGDWLIGELLPTADAGGDEYVDEALEVAERLGSAPPPLPGPARTTWRAPRRTLPMRVARLTRAGVPLLTFRRLRAAAAELPSSGIAHGDYTSRNVLQARAGGVYLVDWEYLGAAPAHVDPLRLWSTLREERDRGRLMGALLRPLSSSARRDVGLLALWLCTRLHAENVSAPSQERNDADSEHARLMTVEAAALARELKAWPL